MYLASLLRFPEVRISRSRFVVKLGLAKGKSRSTENDGGAEYQKTRSSDGYSEPMVGPWSPCTFLQLNNTLNLLIMNLP